MPELTFYQLSDSPLERLLPVLVEKARERDWRVAIQGPIAARLAFLDNQLWTYKDVSFLPHAVAGGAYDAIQPVLLGPVGPAANAAQMLIMVDGADQPAANLEAYERVCVVFDGNDAQMLNAARSQWRTFTGAGMKANYWAREDGRWKQKAASAGA